MNKRWLHVVLLAITVMVVGMALLPVPARAAPGPGSAPANGTVRVMFVTPADVPGTLLLSGKQQFVASKAPAGKIATVTLTVPAGSYRVSAQQVTSNGRLYRGVSAPPQVVVRAGRTSIVGGTYVPVPGARDLRATGVDDTSVALSWAAPSGANFSLRRTAGDAAATSATQGTAVPTSGTSAKDTGLEPGATYSYALFTRLGGVWSGPLTVTAGTVPPAGSTQAAYVASPTTLLATPADITAESTTGNGVRVQLGGQVPTRQVGSAVVLPQSAALPGGYLGVVAAVAPDGRTVDLTGGGMSDAFEYYSIVVPEFGDVPAADLAPDTDPGVAAQAAPDVLPDATPEAVPGERPAPAPTQPDASAESDPQAVPDFGASAVGGSVDCDGGSMSAEIKLEPSVELGGHFSATINKGLFGVPTGASLDMAVTVTATGALSAKSSSELSCQPKSVQPVMKTLTVNPVPISMYLAPTLQVSVAGSIEVSNVGLTATAGVQLAGKLGLTSGASFSGHPLLSAVPLTPKVTVNNTVGFKVGGQLVVGPGAGSHQAGVIAGLGGEFNVLETTFGPASTQQNGQYTSCVGAKAEANWGLSLTAKAWVGGWSVSDQVKLDALDGTFPYFGSPWDLPKGCQDASPVQPGDDLLGNGVSKVSDTTVGSSLQWGHVDGFAPGQKTWVLSTGQMADAVGTPDQFANTNLGEAGDAGLSALAGHETYDAAAYEVTLVPAGNTLHVRYVFASEEYPEYVGSGYNDVMAVLVDGSNCATVPGTDQPVAINSVNAGSNSTYFVDNATGAAGYSTSMDGLTVTLTCSVPVTPGEPVTVRIAVADTSDHAYDSAVALLDKGIWTD